VKGALEIESKSSPKKRAGISRQNLMVFAFFLFLSFIFWYLNSLGKELEADLKYPVKYVNLPKERVFTEEIPAKLNMNLKGPGFSIFKLKHSGKLMPLVIDFARVNYRRVQGSTESDYYIITSGLVKNFTTQMRSECKIISIKPDTLFFSFRKTVPK
jgi:hypothetical protein